MLLGRLTRRSYEIGRVVLSLPTWRLSAAAVSMNLGEVGSNRRGVFVSSRCGKDTVDV
jgi:hypothetical protein